MPGNPLSTLTTTGTALSNLILVSPQNTIGYQPVNPTTIANSIGYTGQQNPPALLFHYEGEQTVAIESDITDHYIEDNTAIQDQVALKPVIITTHGFIGELNDVPPIASAAVQLALQKLTVLSAYTPALTVAALEAYNTAFQLYQVGASAVNSAVSAWSSINSQGGENVIGQTGIGNAVNLATGKVTNNQNKQQVAFQQFYAYWSNRWSFTVQTPWAVFQNMYIQRLRAIQSAETNVITDFEVTFKMIRTVVSATASSSQTISSGRATTQSASPVNQGTQVLAQETPTSQSSAISGSFPSLVA